MYTCKKLIFLLLASCLLSQVQAQTKKFPSPPSADTISNPERGNITATAEGKRVYNLYCATCHGAKGKGDGIAAPGLPKPPADHTSDFVQKQKDGALFWIITMGNNPMPSYKTALTPAQRWDVVNYIRTLAKSKK